MIRFLNKIPFFSILFFSRCFLNWLVHASFLLFLFFFSIKLNHELISFSSYINMTIIFSLQCFFSTYGGFRFKERCQSSAESQYSTCPMCWTSSLIVSGPSQPTSKGLKLSISNLLFMLDLHLRPSMLKVCEKGRCFIDQQEGSSISDK